MLGKARWVGRFFPEMPVHTSNATAVVPAEAELDGRNKGVRPEKWQLCEDWGLGSHDL